MHQRITIVLLIFSTSFITPPAFAQVLPFFTDTALTVGFESNAVRTFGRFVSRSDLRIEGKERTDPLDRNIFVFAQVFAFPIRIDPDTVFIAVAPVLHKEFTLTPPGESRRQVSDDGLGDVTFMLKRRFYQNDFQGGGFQAAFLTGLKLPTGDDDEQDDQGEPLPPSLQLGTGSVDVPVGFVVTTWKDRLGLNAEFLHKFNNASNGFEFGDETQVNLALGYRLVPREYQSMRDKVLTAYLEVNAIATGRASLNGQVVPDSGGTTVFLTPGLQWVLAPRLLIEAAFQIPVVQELNGTQLAFVPTANAGIRLLF